MITIKPVLVVWRITIKWSLLFFLSLATRQLFAETVPLALNLPVVFNDAVVLGKKYSEFKFSIGGIESMSMEIIAPVNGASFTLFDPLGVPVARSTDVNVSKLDGMVFSPPLPGASYMTPTIDAPVKGDWKLRVDYPSAIEKTVVMVTLHTKTLYQAGIVINSNHFIVGQSAALGLLVVNNAQPIAGLIPKLTITPPSESPVVFTGKDTGASGDFDGLANDGIYSGGYTFAKAGDYTIEGRADIPTLNGIIHRSATATVTVSNPTTTLSNISGSKVTDPSGCIAGLNLHIEADAKVPATFVARAQLAGITGQTLEKSSSVKLAKAGALAFDLLFPSTDIIRKNLGESPYVVNSLDILGELSDHVGLEVQVADVLTFPSVKWSDLCKPPIAIVNNLNVGQTLRDGFIESLKFSFAAEVKQAGSYQIAFKLTSGTGQEIQVFNFDQVLIAGSNTIEVNVPYKKFQVADGPYAIESLSITGQGETAHSSLVGKSAALSRWQFFPNITGDLDADGDVDVNDRNLLLTFRGQSALTPGDRRNIFKDGTIDIRDAGSIVSKACKVGICKFN